MGNGKYCFLGLKIFSIKTFHRRNTNNFFSLIVVINRRQVLDFKLSKFVQWNKCEFLFLVFLLIKIDIWIEKFELFCRKNLCTKHFVTKPGYNINSRRFHSCFIDNLRILCQFKPLFLHSFPYKRFEVPVPTKIDKISVQSLSCYIETIIFTNRSKKRKTNPRFSFNFPWCAVYRRHRENDLFYFFLPIQEKFYF